MRKTSVFVASIACGVDGLLILRQPVNYQQVRLHDKLANEFLVSPGPGMTLIQCFLFMW